MNVREEDRQKNKCPSRGLGLAAAAIGVGVGAALYYFFSKRPENPDGEGSTTDWSIEQPHAFSTIETNTNIEDDNSSDSYTTVSEHITSDTSMEDELHNESNEVDALSESLENVDEYNTLEDSQSEVESNENIQSDGDPEWNYNLEDSQSEVESNESIQSDGDPEWNYTLEDSQSEVESNESIQSDGDPEWNVNEIESSLSQSTAELSEMDLNDSVQSVFDINNEWDVTDSSVDVPSVSRLRNPEQLISRFTNMLPNRDWFRERSWSLEECSICFDVILKDHKVTTLPCTHHFHTQCITPWLQEQQTCPNCRKAAE